jgi:hypothetical protein
MHISKNINEADDGQNEPKIEFISLYSFKASVRISDPKL